MTYIFFVYSKIRKLVLDKPLNLAPKLFLQLGIQFVDNKQNIESRMEWSFRVIALISYMYVNACNAASHWFFHEANKSPPSLFAEHRTGPRLMTWNFLPASQMSVLVYASAFLSLSPFLFLSMYVCKAAVVTSVCH